MFLRQTRRKKDGKTHSYWSVVENQRLQGGRVVQRPVLYLGGLGRNAAGDGPGDLCLHPADLSRSGPGCAVRPASHRIIIDADRPHNVRLR